ncbi:MAG: hypothetical protein ABIA92_03235 [Patescibacteria group bacterium]
MSISKEPPSALAYTDLYKGKSLLIKASGKELSAEKLPILAEGIRNLIRNGIHIVLVFGGGQQIDQEWDARHDQARPKVDGVGITNDEVLRDGVLPAYETLRNAIQKAIPEVEILPPSTLQCTLDEGKGLVGLPVCFAGVDDIRNKAIGFVGEVGGQQVNVNADNIVEALVSDSKSDFNEVIMLTETGGVLKDHKLVPLILSEDIAQDGSHSIIKVTSGMKKKLASVKKMLPLIGKVAMTSVAKLLQEIEEWKGSGTLSVDTNQVECTSILPEEEEVVRSVYREYVERGIFRPRSDEQFQEVLYHHFVLRIKNSPLGGFSLIGREQRWMELAMLWSGYLGNGIGESLASNWRKQFETSDAKALFALSTPIDPDDLDEQDKIVNRFTGFGMKHCGLLTEAKSVIADLPPDLVRYETHQRNPHLFVLKKNE